MLFGRLLLLLPFLAFAQNNDIIRRIPLKERVLEAEVDRLGNFYIRTGKSLLRYSPDGELQAAYHWSESEKPTQLSSWNPLQIMVHLTGHNFLLLDQDLNRLPEPDHIDEAFAVSPLLVAAGNLNHVAWLLDTDHSVKKVDWLSSKMLQENYPFTKDQRPNHPVKLRSYQDFLFLLDGEAGLYVIGRTGKLARVIPFQNPFNFGVLGEDIFVCENNQLRFIDIYTEEEYQIELPKETLMAVATDERLLLVSDKELVFKSFRPKID